MEDDILKEFLAESWENLSQLDLEIVELEKHPSDKGLLASIFRTIHTIKGTCGFIGLNRLGAVAHAGENVLGQMRDGVLSATPAAISLVLEGIDAIKELLKGLEETGSEPERDDSALIARLNELAESGQNAGAENNGAATAEPPAPTESAPVTLAEAHVPAGEPTAEPTDEPAAEPIAERTIAELPADSPVESVEAEAAGFNADQDHEGERDRVSDSSRGEDGTKKSIAELSIRVSVDVVDRLMNLVGELVLTRNQLLQMVRGEDESKYAAPITHLNRVTTDLQEGVMKTRMQPIGNAWSKLPRLVRDLSRQMGKQIELEMTGAETELDRTVLDAIKDPLTHMVRNSADHGIEPPIARRQAGKSEFGKIKLHAYHEGGHVIICIEDDGAGIPVAKVKQKAIKSGLINERDAARMSDKELLQLVFQPGLSTAEKVTSVSGRGVGMDVVKTQIERIGGTVDLSSRAGLGTTIRIKIPLTLAIINALVVESGGLTFAIPQLGIVELVRLAAEDRHKIERIHEREVFRLRNRLLPLVHLDEVLELRHGQHEDHDVNIVVVQVGEEQFGLIVAEVFDTEEIVVKPVGQLLKNVSIYQGTTILGDGRVIMILDVTGVAAAFGGLSGGANDRDLARSESDDDDGNTTTLLVFDGGSGTPMAVPLSLVARLEEFPRHLVERSGEKLLVQYRGNLLPLVPVNGEAEGNVDPLPVIVFSEAGSSMGLMVRQIQDILEEKLVIRMSSQQSGVLGTAIVNGKATDIIDTQYYVTQANPEWFRKKGVSRRPRRVLVVDDSIFFRQLVTTALETEGYRVKSVEGGRAALKLLEHGEKFDMIVSDIEMPEMDGYSLATTIRERGLTECPMLALTSLSGSASEAKALRAGFTQHMVKFNARQFLQSVDELSRQAALGTEVSA